MTDKPDTSDAEPKEGELVDISPSAADLIREVSNAWAQTATTTAEVNADMQIHAADVNLAALKSRLQQREREVRRGFWFNAIASGTTIAALLGTMGFLIIQKGDMVSAALIATHVVAAAGGYGFGTTRRRSEETHTLEQ